MTVTIESVYPGVQNIIADVLAVNEDKVELKKSLVNDLGAESIDFLDLVFRLERQFKVKIPHGQIESAVRGRLPEEQFEQKGVITPEGLAVLREYLAEVPSDRFKEGMRVNGIPALFTVETFCKLVVNAANKA